MIINKYRTSITYTGTWSLCVCVWGEMLLHLHLKTMSFLSKQEILQEIGKDVAISHDSLYMCFNSRTLTLPVPWEITDRAFPPCYWCHLCEIWGSRPLAPTGYSCLGYLRHGDRRHPARYSTHTGHGRTQGEELCRKKTDFFSTWFLYLCKISLR